MIVILFCVFTFIFVFYDILIKKNLSMSSLIIFITTFIIIIPGSHVSGDTYFWLFALLGIVFSYLVESFFDNKIVASKISSYKERRINSLLFIISLFYVLITLSQLNDIVISNGGVLNSLLRARVDEYLNGGILNSSIIRSLTYSLMPIYILNLGALLNCKKNYKFLFFYIYFIFYLIITADTRLPLLFLLFTPLYIYFFNRSVLNRVFLFLFGGSFSVFFFVAYINFSALIRSGVGDSFSFIDLFSLDRFGQQLGYREWVSELVSYCSDFGFSYGVQWFLNPFITFIPRFIWQNKPITSTSNFLHQVVGGKTIGDGEYIFTYTIFGEGYFQFGYLGVFLAPIFLVLLFLVNKKMVVNIPGSYFFTVWTLFRFIPFVRAELPVFLTITTIIIIFILFITSRFEWKS